MRFYAILFIVLVIAACDRTETPQPPTAEQSAQLNEAEGMLDNMADNQAGGR